MKKRLLVCFALVLAIGAHAQWKPVGDKLKTKWAEEINPKNVLPEYPRPQMERSDWVNLNGEWEYTIQTKGAVEPVAFEGKILVPFAVESSLSGVQKQVGDKNELWYKRSFTVPANWKNKDIMLHFGAVDWKADVFVNDILIGSHKGGFTPFSFNITPYLTGKNNQKLVVRVWDPSEKGYQPRGKQTSRPEGIWYTSVTGIWQTVWLEPVATEHITAIKAIPDIDNGAMAVTVSASCGCPTNIIEVKLLDKGKVVATAKGLAGKEMRLGVQNPTLWDTNNPYLYDMTVSLSKNGKVVDEVKSYTAFRKISMKKDENGIMRMQLNNKNVFHYGPLDQGWWPDGLYTAPTDEALLYDVVKTKDWGFNMIRKHVKVEPARWYYHCDREGLLVWQDMPSGDMGNQWAPHQYNAGTDKNRSQASVANFYQEWKEIMDFCISSPSVVVWVPFNEAWGQFDTEKVAEWTANYDASRLVNPASGGNHRACGDILDLHNYPGPKMFLFDPQRVNVLGEYGGIGLPMEGHLWQTDKNWGYIQFKDKNAVTAEYVKYANELKGMVDRGFSGAVYTQTTDVEGEVNGLMTYDRKQIKINEADVKKINQEVINQLSK
ncbi:beta-galactosidase [Parabacteroides sp. 52]|uniref:glycoside hydrolase family 2 protein n=1 Tax=unclassified Parabacteroides TaxID=2649774 RepID=UPI0013D2BFF1|nr:MULTISPECIES: sugar-binding domain-containing protein [unclassified Parabacteroides]MDH6534257.1 beta-galactosidase/beta-glucuronidase [Parabacteroides sp. PM5-20]NDV55359.1 beta-galactosidase [Parabacteroides sp. 52]